MGKLRMESPYGLDATPIISDLPAGLPESVLRKAASMGLQRVAGNTFICESTKDFWQVRGNRLIKLVGNEVDNGESLAAAPEDDPGQFLEDILGDLTW